MTDLATLYAAPTPPRNTRPPTLPHAVLVRRQARQQEGNLFPTLTAEELAAARVCSDTAT